MNELKIADDFFMKLTEDKNNLNQLIKENISPEILLYINKKSILLSKLNLLTQEQRYNTAFILGMLLMLELIKNQEIAILNGLIKLD